MNIDALPRLNSLGSDSLHRDPGPRYQVIHADTEHALYRHPVGAELVITGYRDLQAVLKHPAMQAQNQDARSSGPDSGGALARLFASHPVFMNEPRHRPVRLAATAAIGVNRNDWIDAQIQEIATDLIATMKRAGGGDLVTDFAFELSARVWSRILDVPESNATLLQECARGIAGVLEFEPDAAVRAGADSAATDILDLLVEWDCAGTPSHTSRDLVQARFEEAPDPSGEVTPMELLGSLTFDAVDGAGGMTGNFLYCLLSEDGALRALREDRGAMGAHWLEAARLHPPLLGLFRCATEDLQFEGFSLARGQNVLTLNAAGNRDPRIFDDPDSYRPQRSPNRPLTFGFGSRGCIGRYLASRQGELGVAALLTEVEQMTLSTTEVDWGQPSLLRAVQSLPVEFH